MAVKARVVKLNPQRGAARADGSLSAPRPWTRTCVISFIVSSEDGVELSDLRTTTRDLMQQMETDLGTKLDWIAVDHHNTGHPHTHK